MTLRSISNGLVSREEGIGMKSGNHNLYFNEPDSKENIKLFNRIRKDIIKGFEMVEFYKIDRTIKKIEIGDYIN